MFEILGTIVLVVSVLGILYLFGKVLFGFFSAISKNDD